MFVRYPRVWFKAQLDQDLCPLLVLLVHSIGMQNRLHCPLKEPPPERCVLEGRVFEAPDIGQMQIVAKVYVVAVI